MKYLPYEITSSNLLIAYPSMNIKSGEVGGYNIYKFLTYIIENYNDLPANIFFIKGNIINRHFSQDFFLKFFQIINTLNRLNNGIRIFHVVKAYLIKVFLFLVMVNGKK